MVRSIRGAMEPSSESGFAGFISSSFKDSPPYFHYSHLVKQKETQPLVTNMILELEDDTID